MNVYVVKVFGEVAVFSTARKAIENARETTNAYETIYGDNYKTTEIYMKDVKIEKLIAQLNKEHHISVYYDGQDCAELLKREVN